MKNCTFWRFFANIINPAVVSRWFLSLKRSQQIKRFLKVYHPEKAEDDKNDKMGKFQEVYDVFILVCKLPFSTCLWGCSR